MSYYISQPHRTEFGNTVLFDPPECEAGAWNVWLTYDVKDATNRVAQRRARLVGAFERQADADLAAARLNGNPHWIAVAERRQAEAE